MLPLEGRALLGAVTVLTCLGFLLIGFDNGLMGGFIDNPNFTRTFGLHTNTTRGTNILALVVAIYEIGCFFGAITTSISGERLGRRGSILVGICFMIAGAVLQASAYSLAQLIVGRIVSGYGMGFINSTIPVLQAEFSPKQSRGRYVCMQLSTLNFGIMLVYWIGYAFNQRADIDATRLAWRVTIILQCVFLIAMILLALMIPETPRWLASHHRSEECFDVLQRLHSYWTNDNEIRIMHAVIMEAVALETSIRAGGWRDLLLEKDVINTRRRFLIACSIQAFQQLGGINALIYYSTTLFMKSLGFGADFAGIMSGALNTWFFIASFIPWALIDRVGRRPLLLSMVSLMAAVMAVQAALIYQVQYNTSIAAASGIAAAAMLFVFQGAFTIGFQAIVWVYPAEILPLKWRQKGSSVSTACNWIMNFLVVYITPPALHNIGWGTYIIFAVLNASFVPIMYTFYPETKGLALEEMKDLFQRASMLSSPEPCDEEAELVETLPPDSKALGRDTFVEVQRRSSDDPEDTSTSATHYKGSWS